MDVNVTCLNFRLAEPAPQAFYIPTFISYTSDLRVICNYRDVGTRLIYSFYREKYRIDKT